MKLGSDTERNKGNMVTSKKLTVTPRRQFEKNVSFFNLYWICRFWRPEYSRIRYSSLPFKFGTLLLKPKANF